MTHILSESLESHCYRKAVLPDIKSADDKKNELSIENSVKLCAIVFGYYVNAFLCWWPLFTANYFCAFVITLTSPTANQSKFIAWIRVKVHLTIHSI